MYGIFYERIVYIVKEYLEAHHCHCRVAKNQFEIAYLGTRNGYDTAIIYFTNRSSGVKLYIDWDISRNMANEILEF